MRISRFKLSRYRGIHGSATVPFSTDLTTLIGPNNEGKSTILTALGVALDVLSNVPSPLRNPTRGQVISLQSNRFSFIPPKLRYFESAYDWDRDYPLSLRQNAKLEPSRFEVDFELTPEDCAEFKAEVKSSLDGHLPIALSVNREGVWTYSIPKRGRGSTLSSKAPAIAKYLKQRIELQYVPAVRTAQDAQQMINHYVTSRVLTDKMLSEISDEILRIMDNESALTTAAADVCEALQPFIAAGAAEFGIQKERLRRAIEPILQLNVDDGSLTPLRMKGDGVVSLVSIGLARHYAQGNKHGALMLVIEEPESHLHPEKACELQRVLTEVSRQNQVVVTTHSPALVQRSQITSNIVVKSGGASPARSLKSIRDALGIRLGHNLASSELLILVEGESDAAIIGSALRSTSSRIADALDQGTVAIGVLGGASNLSYHARVAGGANLCDLIAVLDDDEEGRRARVTANSDGVLSDGDITLTTRIEARESELEDLLDTDTYRDAVNLYFGGASVLSHHHFSSGGSKWSERLSRSARSLGRPWDKSTEKAVKTIVANEASKLALDAFTSTGRQPITALAATIEHRMDSLGL